MRSSRILWTAIVLGLASGAGRTDEKVHWVCEGANVQPVEYLELQAEPAPSSQTLPPTFKTQVAVPAEAGCAGAEACAPQVEPVTPAAFLFGKPIPWMLPPHRLCKTACNDCPNCCCADAHHHCDVKGWLFYRVQPFHSGYACMRFPPAWSYFLDSNCNPGWDGWQPCHGTDCAQHGCCPAH